MNITIDFSKPLSLAFEPNSVEAEIVQSLYILMNTRLGEVPCYREFGIDNSFLHKPLQAAKTMYAAAITEAVERFITGVRVNRVMFADNAETPTTLCPILEVTIIE